MADLFYDELVLFAGVSGVHRRTYSASRLFTEPGLAVADGPGNMEVHSVVASLDMVASGDISELLERCRVQTDRDAELGTKTAPTERAFGEQKQAETEYQAASLL